MDNDGNQQPDGQLGDAPDGGEEQVDQYFDEGGEVFLAADHVSNSSINLLKVTIPCEEDLNNRLA